MMTMMMKLEVINKEIISIYKTRTHLDVDVMEIITNYQTFQPITWLRQRERKLISSW